MFKEFSNGTSTVIQNVTVHFPPISYVPNYYAGSGELIPSEILFGEYPEEEQYWRVIFDRKAYDLKRTEEQQLQKTNPSYVDGELEEIRIIEWKRRLNGVWIFNNGKPIYITGLYYFYLSHWKLDIGLPSFRIPDWEDFVFWQVCITNPKCLGQLVVSVRRWGKTYTAGVKMFEYIARQKRKNGGIQSKTDTDARDSVYNGAIIAPFKQLVDFFKPMADLQKGAVPKKELSFVRTITKDVDIKEAFDNELASLIDYKPSDKVSYDGRKLFRYIGDECGKTMLVDVYDRHNVVKKCLSDTDRDIFIGKMIATTTVADISEGGAEFQKYWDASNQQKINENTGETESGLYRFLITADKTKNFDKYGYPDIEKNKKIITAKLAQYLDVGDIKTYSHERRINPLSEADLFTSDSEACPFNVAVIDAALQYISQLPNNHRERARIYDLVWDIPDKKVKAIPNNVNGKWSITWLPPETQQNLIHDSGHGQNRFKPLNDDKISIGCDPVSAGLEAEHGSSDAAIAVYRKADIYNESELFSENFIADYVHDPDNPEDFYEDLIIACFFFGCQVLIEKNKFDVYNYFKKRGYLECVMDRPSNTVSITNKTELTEGIAAGTYTIDLYITRLKSWWSLHGHKCRQPRILEDARRFTVKTRGKRDLTVACGWTRLAAEKPYKPKTMNIPIGDVFTFRSKQNRH